MYKKIIRPFLFLLDAEKAHGFAMFLLRLVNRLPFLRRRIFPQSIEDKSLEREVFGLKFKNPVGLAAGFDKDAKYYHALSRLGFGFVEIGTLTPKPQEGNPKKRLFRLIEDGGIINRMGFNNEGVEAAVERLKKKGNILLGGNIGKNKITPNEKALDDYIVCFEKLFPYVDYFAINVSSPNTPNLRDLQGKEPLTKLLISLQNHNCRKNFPKPILLKIAPDLSNPQLLEIIEIVEKTKIAGVIATNTTLERKDLRSQNKTQKGGLSGKPLKNRATEVIKFLSDNSKNSFPIIGVGGIHSARDAMEKLEAGASLVQLYTGFIYEGPRLVREINTSLLAHQKKDF
ncbi:MAG: quinone-dependent dihydroorotate dehydrogenase [Bergeyella sp.]|nr:quinone-dependent dihydroorotate dehydrogenase [Bergeyella sp.]